jgi:hypothetical protein
MLSFLLFGYIMADVASKQQTTAFILSTVVARTRRHTELTKKLTHLMGNLCYARQHSVQFSCSFFTQFNLRVCGAFYTLIQFVHWNSTVISHESFTVSQNFLLYWY